MVLKKTTNQETFIRGIISNLVLYSSSWQEH